ncbi:MAG: hypothetical protein HQL02_06755 [Nitrospirae bacterium]|nr:hypothetical protein [Nitrospirota bacterium]
MPTNLIVPPQKKLQIFIYRKDVQEGAFFISIGKLYWDDIVGDGYHSKIEQNSLEQHANLLEEVVVNGIRKNRETVFFKSYEDFLVAIGIGLNIGN